MFLFLSGFAKKWLFFLLTILLISVSLWYLVNDVSGLKIFSLMNDIIPQTAPFLNTQDLAWSENLRAHTDEIRQEYYAYINSGKKLPSYDAIIHNRPDTSDTFKHWKIIILRTYNKDTNNMNFFPKLQQYIASIPGCSVVMFSLLDPREKIGAHRGPNRGVLRYHLAIETPPILVRDNCYLVVNNIKYSWKNGQDVLFDDTYSHYVINDTDYTRVVLFLDIEKPLTGYKKYLNKLVLLVSPYNGRVKKIVERVNDYSA